jgi:hypothetical protein
MSGAGLSGIITTELRVKLRLENDDFTAPDNAEVIIHIPGVSVNPFYIAKREKRGRELKLLCRSKIYQLDRPADFSDNDFDENGEIGFDTAMSRIAGSAGFTATVINNLPQCMQKLKKGFLKGANCMSILEKISAALVGTFREYGGAIVFCPWEGVFMEAVPAEPLSPINYGCEKQISHLVMSDKADSFAQGSGGYARTLTVKTPLASNELVSAVYGRVHEHIYKPFECKLMRIASVPAIGCTLSLNHGTDEQTELFCNNIRIYVKKSGLYAAAACNAVNEDEWDYAGELERAVEEKIAADERFGGMTLTGSGTIKLENSAHIADPTAGHTATISADEEFGVNIETDKAQIKAETLDLSNTPSILLKSTELLTESKDLIGAINELFSAAPEGGDSAVLPTLEDLLEYSECYKMWNWLKTQTLAPYERAPYYLFHCPNGSPEKTVAPMVTVFSLTNQYTYLTDAELNAKIIRFNINLDIVGGNSLDDLGVIKTFSFTYQGTLGSFPYYKFIANSNITFQDIPLGEAFAFPSLKYIGEIYRGDEGGAMLAAGFTFHPAQVKIRALTDALYGQNGGVFSGAGGTVDCAAGSPAGHFEYGMQYNGHFPNIVSWLKSSSLPIVCGSGRPNPAIPYINNVELTRILNAYAAAHGG